MTEELHVNPMDRLRPIDLAAEIKASEIPEETMALFRQHSAGVLSLDDFAALWPSVQKARSYGLGITDDKGMYEAATRAYGLTNWFRAYQEWAGRGVFGIKDGDILFLDYITRTGQQAVFFVPPMVFSHPSANVTRKEIEWFSQNPERATDTLFVFGLYSAINPQVSLPQDPRTRVLEIERMLRNKN